MNDAPATAADCQAQAVVSVLLPLPLACTYDYRVPADMKVELGSFVEAPLGPRRVVGVAWAMPSRATGEMKLRDIISVLNLPPIGKAQRAFIDWVAGYNLALPGSVLRMTMSIPAAFETPRPRAVVVRGEAAPSRLTSQRAAVLAALDGGGPMPPAALARSAGVGAGVVRGLIESGVLHLQAASSENEPGPPAGRESGPVLSSAQTSAARSLVAEVAARRFAVCLLDGVTGAGKTEVYFEAIAAAIGDGRQALVLLPEIALSAQWLTRFQARFGFAPAQWHSSLTPSRRRETWRGVIHGRARVVVGARSAVFLPYPDLGLIVVDEEHDGSYKQEDGVVYNARDMAVVRGRLAGAPVVLASATPSVETVSNVDAGRYRRLHLPDRYGGASTPTVEAIDLRAKPPERGRWLSAPLVAAVEQAIDRGEQAMLFLNRRGYAPLTLCRACGHRLECPNCSAWLVEHRLSGDLRCHHCDYRRAVPEACPACRLTGSLVACGPGIERLAEEVAERFPTARAAVMTSDTVPGPAAAQALIAAMQDGDLDLLIGTQMITKGHHFPALTLVGVVDADLGLSGGDLRAAERTYQLLFQVAGRAGRADRAGRGLLQTHDPAHPVMQALISGDRDRFVETEIAVRRAARMPPFGRLAAIIVSGTDAARTAAAALALRRAAPREPELDVLGPAPAPLAVVRGRHRFRLLVKGPRDRPLQPVVRSWLAAVKVPSGLRIQVDIDPYSFV